MPGKNQSASIAGGNAPAPDRLRVLLVIKALRGGGAERILVMLARHVSREKFEPHLASLSLEGPYRRDIPDDVTIHQLKGRAIKWAIPQLVSVVRRIKPHVVVSTLIESNTAVLLAQPFFPAGTKVIVRETLNPSSLWSYLPAGRVWRLLYRRLIRRADAVACQSRSMQADVVQELSVELAKTTQIYNGVDTALLEQRATGPSPYPGEGPNLLAVGRLDSQKNFSMLLESFASIRKAIPGAKLTILGSGPDEAKLKQQARDLDLTGSVTFAGYEDNPFPFYRHADLYVQTSVCEGLPNALLEVLLLGVPAVATRETGATEEVAEVAGSVRVVREPGAAAFAKAVVEFFNAPRPEFHREAFLHTFGVEQMTAGYERLLMQVAGTSSAGTGQAKGAGDGA